MKRIGVVLAGGSGERFWPLSRISRPKQLLKLADSEKTLLQEAVDRLAPLVGPEDLYIAATSAVAGPIRESAILPESKVLVEPAKRNTLGALVWTHAWILSQSTHGEDATLAIVTADHLIGDDEGFSSAVETAMSVAESTDGLVTIGISPTRPDTAYGYIEGGESVGDGVQRVRRFHEKPDQPNANRYVETGGYYWNSGMFFWRLSSFAKALSEVRRDIASVTVELVKALRSGDTRGAEQLFAQLPDESIDIALMERAAEVYVVEGSFVWDDLGSWDSMDRAGEADTSGNLLRGQVIALESANSTVVNDSDAITVAVLGISDLVVVVTGDAVLVCPKERVQQVRKVVEALRKSNSSAL